MYRLLVISSLVWGAGGGRVRSPRPVPRTAPNDLFDFRQPSAPAGGYNEALHQHLKICWCNLRSDQAARLQKMEGQVSDHHDLIFGSWAVCDSHSTADVWDRCRVSYVTSVRRLQILIYSIDTRMKEKRRKKPTDNVWCHKCGRWRATVVLSAHTSLHTSARTRTHTLLWLHVQLNH